MEILLEEFLRLRDLEILTEEYLDVSECEKGRLIVSGYCCPYCGSDDPENSCKGKSYDELTESLQLIEFNKK